MTILYARDFERYPTAVVDDKSKNVSWVEQCAKFQAMGVKNYYFPLTLLQPQLRDFDPFDPDLPEDVILLMMLECANNPWYFLREIFRVPAKSGGGSGPLLANRGNIAMFWCFFNSFVTYVQQIRQTGKTLNTRALVMLFHNVMARNSQHILFTKGDLRKEEIKEYKAMRALLPKWMWYLHPKDADNQHEFTTLSRGNRTKTYIPQGDPEAANNVGRGTSPTFVNVDEPPFLPYAEISIPALVAATTASFDEAKRLGAMHGILYTTTAGDLSTDSGKFVYEKIKKAGMFFSEMLYDCENREAAVKMILANSKSSTVPFVDISFSHLQLGYSDDWLREKIGTTPASRDKIKRDYLGQWTFGSANNPIKEKILNVIRDHVNEKPFTVETKESYLIRYHVHPDEVKKRKSVLGLDTSNAVGRDSITGVLTDVETSEVLAVFGVSEISLTRFAYRLVDMFVELPHMTLIPEAKSSWDGIRDILLIELPLRGIDPGKRIYSRLVDRANGSESDKRNYREYSMGVPTERKYFPYRNEFGFPTSGTLRESLYVDTLREATRDAPKLIRDPVLVDELSSLVERNNRIDHKASGHDDHVISWLLTQWFLRNARNLDHYGIDASKVLSRLKIVSMNDDPKEAIRVNKNDRILKEIAELEAKLEESKSTIEQKYLMSRIAVLKSEVRVDDNTVPSGSLDKISGDARAKRTADFKTRSMDGVFSRGGLFNRWDR